MTGVVIGAILVAAGLPWYVGVVVLVVVGAGVAVWIWSRSPASVLASIDARPSDEDERPRLHNLVDGLCATMGLPRPSICVVDSTVPNAMALGRDPARASLVVTSSLDEVLTLVELEGVLAHELVHIKRHDTVLAGVAVTVSIPWTMLRGVSVGADRVHTLIGRGRGFDADQRAARVVRYPPGIASALARVTDGSDRASRPAPSSWPTGTRRAAEITRWLWFDPMAGPAEDESMEGNLDDTRVRAAALSLY